MIDVALIGCGTMGKNHARTIDSSSEFNLAMVVDINGDAARLLGDQYGVEWSKDLRSATEVDAFVVAASTDSHRYIFESLKEDSKPLLLEKPIAVTKSDIEEILGSARSANMVLMCGFVERYNAAFLTAVSLLGEDEEILHVSFKRHSPSSSSRAGSVLWDVMIHDVDLLFRLLGDDAKVSVLGAQVDGTVRDSSICVANLRVGGTVVEISSSTVGHRKVRELSITTDQRLIEIDLLRQNISVYRHFDHRIGNGRTFTYKSTTEVEIPFVRFSGEPLVKQLSHFARLIEGGVDLELEYGSIILPHSTVAEIEERIDPYN